MINNRALVESLAKFDQSLGTSSQRLPTARKRVLSNPCLPLSLPAIGVIEREAKGLAPRAIIRQLRYSPSPPTEQEHPERERRESIISSKSHESSKSNTKLVKQAKLPSWKDPQPFEVFRAIERKDLAYLMEVRDRAFHLLLRRTGDATPLIHAMRIGQSHREVAIVLLGAFSRWVNHLDDEDMSSPKTKVLLKALRANLKVAIDYGLQRAQSDLTASFLQTLIMSEGEKWVRAQTETVALALRAGNSAKPVHSAESVVRSFATKELGKAEAIATLEDYISNATADLLMMGAWSIVLDGADAQPIPAWYFARDDRVYKAFCERLDAHRGVIERMANRRTRWQLRVLRKALEGRAKTFHMKIEDLKLEFDEGEGL